MNNEKTKKMNRGLAVAMVAGGLTTGALTYKSPEQNSERQLAPNTPTEQVANPKSLQSNSLGQMPSAANSAESVVVDIVEGRPVEAGLDNHANNAPVVDPASIGVSHGYTDPNTLPADIPGQSPGVAGGGVETSRPHAGVSPPSVPRQPQTG